MLEPGDAVDVWVVDRALGQGGMGSVYRCHNRNAPRILAAVKVLELPTRRQPETTARFVREAEILFGLDHPNIVKVRNIRTEHDPPYLEMEFVEGESLEDTLQRGPIEGDRAVDVIRQCAKALQYLHRRGVRHRDIKPANFLLRTDGRVKLVDFGLALEQDVSRITQAGMAFGTVSYAPPEWANPERLDPVKWDMYALGVLMFEILTGDVAFPVSGQGSARQQAMQVVLSKQGHPPLDPGEAHPRFLRAVIAELTDSNVDTRLSDATELLRRLGVEVRGSALDTTSEEDHPSVITTVPTPGVPMPRRAAPDTWHADASKRGPKPGGRRWLLGGVVAAMAVAGMALGFASVGGLLWYTSSADQRDVEIVVSGITADTPHHLRLDARGPDRSTGLAHQFDAMNLGDFEVHWAIGGGCDVDVCREGGCPVTCGHGVSPVSVEPGSGRGTIVVDVPAPVARSVRISLPPLPDDVPVDVLVAGEATTVVAGGRKTEPVAPGTHDVQLMLGSCPPDAKPCDDDCPTGCLVVGSEVVVPWSGMPDDPEWAAGLTDRWAQHTRPADPVPAPAAAPSPAPAPAPAPARKSGPLVTQQQLATWLEGAGAIYQPGAPKDYKNGHLAGWNGTTPPAPKAPVVGIGFPAARAYCKGHGGLASVADAVPATASTEWRVDAEGKPAVVMLGTTDATSTPGTGGYMGTTSFRCRR